METPKSGSAGDSPALNVSKTLAASGGCVWERADVQCPPLWWELRLGLPWQLVSTAGAAASLPSGFAVSASTVLLLAEPGSTPEPLGLPHLSWGLVDAVVQRPPSVRAMGKQGAHPSLTT